MTIFEFTQRSHVSEDVVLTNHFECSPVFFYNMTAITIEMYIAESLLLVAVKWNFLLPTYYLDLQMLTIDPSKTKCKAAIVANYPYKWLILRDIISTKDNDSDA